MFKKKILFIPGWWGAVAGLLLVAACTGPFSPHQGSGSPSALRASAVPSRSSGHAPLGVEFDAAGSSSPLTSQPFQDLRYHWDFGDPGAGTWANGAQSSSGPWSKDQDSGPLAGHVFETPGTYTVTLEVYDGVSTATTTQTITVTGADGFYPGTQTICVSASGVPRPGDPGVPSGARCVQAATLDGSDGRLGASSYLTGSNQRLLFKAGDTWTCLTQDPFITGNNVTIGSYGPGPSPTVNVPGTMTGGIDGIFVLTGDDTVVMDINFTTGFLPSDIFDIRPVSMSGTNNLQLRLTGHTVPCLVYAGGWGDIIQDCTLLHPAGGAGKVGFWLADGFDPSVDGPDLNSHLCFMGNRVDDAHLIEHNVRSQGISYALYSHNSLSYQNPVKHLLAIRGDSAGDGKTSGGKYTQFILVCDNAFGVDGGGDLQVAPENNTSDEPIRNVIIERNLFTCPALGPAGPPAYQVLLGVSSGLAVRNNLAYYPGAGNSPTFFIGFYPGFNTYGVPPCTQAQVANNSYFGTLGSFTYMEFLNSADPDDPTNDTGIAVVNNLVYDPQVTSTGFENGANGTNCGYLVYFRYFPGPFNPVKDNSTDTQIRTVNPGWTVPSATSPGPVGFGFPTSGYSPGSGVPGAVWEDYNRLPRTGPMDQGAFVHG